MKFLFDLFPVILFFAVFKLAGAHPEPAQALALSIGYQADAQHLPVLLATAAAMLATLAQVIWVKLRHGRVDTMLWVSFFLIVILGSATLLLHDETFIKFKPTALYWAFAGALLVSRLLFKRNLVRNLLQELLRKGMEGKLVVPDATWDRFNLAWSVFFMALGGINLYVASHYATDTWVKFKLFGATSMLFAFMLLQILALARYIQPDEKEKN
ncbi:MAG TPA: septation protein A [Gallionellaceae bacterium]